VKNILSIRDAIILRPS